MNFDEVSEQKNEEGKIELSKPEKEFENFPTKNESIVLDGSKPKKKKKKKTNPNILYYPPHIIYAAVGNENIPDKRIPAPVREDADLEVVPFTEP